MAGTNEVMAMAASAACSRMELCPSVVRVISKDEYDALYEHRVGPVAKGMNGFLHFETDDGLAVCHQVAFSKYVILSRFEY